MSSTVPRNKVLEKGEVMLYQHINYEGKYFLSKEGGIPSFKREIDTFFFEDNMVSSVRVGPKTKVINPLFNFNLMD